MLMVKSFMLNIGYRRTAISPNILLKMCASINKNLYEKLLLMKPNKAFFSSVVMVGKNRSYPSWIGPFFSNAWFLEHFSFGFYNIFMVKIYRASQNIAQTVNSFWIRASYLDMNYYEARTRQILNDGGVNWAQ